MTVQSKQDGNRRELLDGVERMDQTELARQGHRYVTCPDFTAITVIATKPLGAALMNKDVVIPTAVALCSCGAFLRQNL